MPSTGELSAVLDAKLRLRLGAAWAVHVFTASGVVIGLLALLAVVAGDARAALLWLGLAMFVDGIDGPAARLFGVREVIPRVDGATLDNVVDYFTYVVVPAVFMWQFELLPGSLAVLGAAYILATSLYTFANLDLKTSDNYFVGFPAVWNIVAFYMFVLETPPLANLIATVVLGVLTFTPLKFVHPLRVRELRIPTFIATAAWALSSLWLVVQIPKAAPWALAVWIASSVYLGWISLRRTLRGKPA
jgi:phosphatidylcholine synthase